MGRDGRSGGVSRRSQVRGGALLGIDARAGEVRRDIAPPIAVLGPFLWAEAAYEASGRWAR